VIRFIFRISYGLVVFGWLAYIFLCVWGMSQPERIRVAIAVGGLLLLAFGSVFHVHYEGREREDANAAEKKQLKESVKLYTDAKNVLEAYVYEQKKKESEIKGGGL